MNTLSRQALTHARDALSAAIAHDKKCPPPSVLADLGAALISVGQAISGHTNHHGVADWYQLLYARRALRDARSLFELGRVSPGVRESLDWRGVHSVLGRLLSFLESEPDLTIPGILTAMRLGGLHAQAAEVDRLLTAVGAGGVDGTRISQ